MRMHLCVYVRHVRESQYRRPSSDHAGDAAARPPAVWGVGVFFFSGSAVPTAHNVPLACFRLRLDDGRNNHAVRGGGGGGDGGVGTSARTPAPLPLSTPKLLFARRPRVRGRKLGSRLHARPHAAEPRTDPSPPWQRPPPYPPYRRRGVSVGVGNHPPHALGDGPHRSGAPDVRNHSAVHPPQKLLTHTAAPSAPHGCRAPAHGGVAHGTPLRAAQRPSTRRRRRKTTSPAVSRAAERM